MTKVKIIEIDNLSNKTVLLLKGYRDNSKIEFNMQADSGGQPFLDRWLKHSEAEIVEVPVDEWATANVLERFVPLFGRYF